MNSSQYNGFYEPIGWVQCGSGLNMIKKIAIKNFRSLLDVNVELAPITVLAGRSGTGKSNFVDAMAFLSSAIEHGSHPQNLVESIVNFGGWDRIRPANLKGHEFHVGFELHFQVPAFSGDFNYGLALQFPNGRVADESLTHNGRVLFHQRAGNWVTKPDLATTGSLGSVMLGWLTGLPEVNVAYVSLVKAIRCYDFPGNVLATNSQPAPTGAEALNKDGSNAFRIIDGILGSIQSLGNWREIEASLKILTAALIGVTVNPFSGEKIGASFKLGDSVASIGLSQQSEGFRRFLAQMIAIYQNPTQQVVIFEEPEKGIFPGALSLLADHIKSANEKLGTQFILTTHSPQLLDAFPGEAIRWVKFSDRGTDISPLAADDLLAIKEGLLTPGEFLTVADPGTPEPA